MDIDTEKPLKKKSRKKHKKRKYSGEEGKEYSNMDSKDTEEVSSVKKKEKINTDEARKESLHKHLREEHSRSKHQPKENSDSVAEEESKSIDPVIVNVSATERKDELPSLDPVNDTDDDIFESDNTNNDTPIQSVEMYRLSERPCPVFLHQEVRSQTIQIRPLLTDTQMYSIHCVFVRKDESTPSTELLLNTLLHNSPGFRSMTDNPIITLTGPELALVKQVACIVASSDYTFFPPILLDIPLDVGEESPDISIFIESEHPNSVEYRVQTTIPCFIWCAAFLVDSPSPSISELMHYPKRFLRDKWLFSQDRLQPESLYDMYCYAESVRGSPMKVSLEETRVPFETLRGI